MKPQGWCTFSSRSGHHQVLFSLSVVVKSFQDLVGHVSHRRVDSVDCSSDFPRAKAEARIPQKKNELKQRVQRGEEAGTRKPVVL